MKIERHSGQVWSKKMNISILDPKGWDSVDAYNHILIDKDEFCNRASNSTLVTKSNVTRRNAGKMLKSI